jgi:hypothetical protein
MKLYYVSPRSMTLLKIRDISLRSSAHTNIAIWVHHTSTIASATEQSWRVFFLLTAASHIIVQSLRASPAGGWLCISILLIAITIMHVVLVTTALFMLFLWIEISWIHLIISMDGLVLLRSSLSREGCSSLSSYSSAKHITLSWTFWEQRLRSL